MTSNRDFEPQLTRRPEPPVEYYRPAPLPQWAYWAFGIVIALVAVVIYILSTGKAVHP